MDNLHGESMSRVGKIQRGNAVYPIYGRPDFAQTHKIILLWESRERSISYDIIRQDMPSPKALSSPTISFLNSVVGRGVGRGGWGGFVEDHVAFFLILL